MHESDFTEAHYRVIVRRARERYAFASFTKRPTCPHVLWRHDVDMSPHRALALARIEADEGVTATYFFLLRSSFYNLLEPDVAAIAQKIGELGHEIGLHFDTAAARLGSDADALEVELARERDILEHAVGRPVPAVSWHNPEFTGALRYDQDESAGMVNAYGAGLKADYEYISDSNGYWRFKRLFDVVDRGDHDRLHVVTHPVWWQREAMSASERVDRAISGRARALRRDYDRLLSVAGRDNIGATPAVTVGQVLAFLDDPQTLGAPDPNEVLERPAALGAAGPGTLTFAGAAARALPEQLRASAVILDEQLRDRPEIGAWTVGAIVVSTDARLDFVRVVGQFFTPLPPTGIHDSAVVSPDARIADDAYVGPGCTIGPHCEVGSGSALHAGVHLQGQVRIGRGVVVHAGTVIGADGFGYATDDHGDQQRFPHLGGVVIEDEAEIGANTCIDRGTLGDTVIEAGAKVDNLVHIAHNVRVGARSMVIALSMVGGSTSVGEGAWVAPAAAIRDGLSIGDRAVVGLGAVVTRDVPAGETVFGVPARPRHGNGG